MVADVAEAAAGEVVAEALADEDSVSPAGVELTDDLAAARWSVLQQLGVLVHLVGTLQYLPDPCVVKWSKVTKGDDQLLPQREAEMALVTATPEVTQIKQDSRIFQMAQRSMLYT